MEPKPAASSLRHSCMPTLRITSPYCVVIAARLRTSGLIIREYKIHLKFNNFYKIEIIVLCKHQALRHRGNSKLDIKIASNAGNFAWQPRLRAHTPRSWQGKSPAENAGSVRPRRCHDGIEDEAERACGRHLLRLSYCCRVRNVLIMDASTR